MQSDTTTNPEQNNDTPDELTPNGFLRLNKSEVEEAIARSLPVSESEMFVPARYSPEASSVLKQVKQWKNDYVSKSQERKQILNWVIPLILIGPGLIAVIATGGVTPVAAITFTVTAMVAIGFLWFFGRVWRWEAKQFEKNVTYADKAVESIRNERARAWAATRYELDNQGIEWAEFSNFYINHRAYRWKEVQEGEFIITDVETGNEAPRI